MRKNKSTLDRLLSYKDVKSKLSISKKGEHFSFGDVGNLKSTVLNLRNKAVDEVYTAATGSRILNLYRDIESLYLFYLKDKKALSADFIVLFRMSLRFLAEAAWKDLGIDLKTFIEKYFDQAKSTLSKDAKTSLSNQNVSKETMEKLFHTGAYDYTNSRNEEQALAMSIILGAILTISHGK